MDPTAARSAAMRDPGQVIAFWSAARTVLGPLLRWTWGFDVTGAERMPQGPVIVVANHVSNVDPLLLGYALPRPGAFMAKAELFRVPGVTQFIKAAGAFPVTRGKGDTGAVETALAVLDAGWPLILYPEGTRNATGRWGTKRLRTGTARIALTRPVPIQPIAMIGTERILPKGALWPRRVRAEARFGYPLLPEDYLPDPDLPESERLALIMAKVDAAMRELLPAHLVAEPQ